MKKILTLCGLLVASLSYGQCTLTGLNSFYCASDSGSQLSSSCGGSSGTILGPGMNSSGYFNPSGLQDSIPILVLAGTTTYTIDQSLPFDPDTTSGGSSVSLSDDQVSGQLGIGFTFRFFDNQYTTFQISSNGFITFGSNSDNGCCSGDYIPSSQTPNNFIAHVWNDLYPPGGGTIKYLTVGTAPNRKCLINFNGIPQCCGTSYPRYSQIQLFEGCGRIEIHTQSQPYPFGSSTQGIENSNGSTGYATPGRNSQSWTTTNDFVSFQPNCGDTFWTYVSDGPSLSLMGDSNDCFLDSNATATVTPTGASPFSYAWSNGETTASITGIPQGTFTVTVTDDDGCYKSEEIDIYSPPFLNVSSNASNANCESDANGSAEAHQNGGVTPYTYAWSNGGTADSIGGLTQGTYTVTVTDANGCENASTATVGFDNADPVVDLGPDKMICPGKISLLTTTPGYESYAWSTGDTVPNIVIQAAGTYTVTVTTVAGCSGSDEIQVVEAVPVQVELGPNQEGYGPIMVDAGSQFNQFLWSTGANTQIISVGQTGTYAVTVADSNGCSSNDDVKVSIWPASVEDIGKDEFAVFPNPAATSLTLMSGSAQPSLYIRLIDMSGQVVMETTTSLGAGEQRQLDVSTYPRGSYLLEMRNDDIVRQRSVLLH
ncbi:MAG: T9SS type A sorting domain-containing protein [Flavobacteriales bacterium]|nr:T9SS type A sorting domain-containing protein [Flavobacteriales bacterium]